MREIYLIGVNHKYQFGPDGLIIRFGPPEAFAEFRQFLKETVAAHGIRGIAEEMSRAALRRHFIPGDSFPCRVAAELGLPHRYCDPEADTQTKFTNPQREQYWVKELLTFDKFPLIFVLGAKHVESFECLSIESGFRPFTIARDWKESSNPDGAV